MNDYDAFPNHPLNGVPDAVLQAARGATADAVRYKDLDPDIPDGLADAVISAAYPQSRRGSRTPSRCR